MWFSDIMNLTQRFPLCDKSYGAVRCGFEKSEILRWGSVRLFEKRKDTGAVRFCDMSYGPVRFGSVPCWVNYFLRPVSNPRKENRTSHAFFMVPRTYKPY